MQRYRNTPTPSDRNGATLVEFAFVFPIFLMVIFFFFEAWQFQQYQQTVDQVALDTARAVIVPGASVSEARTRGTRLLESIGAYSATLTVTPDPILETTDQVTVTVSLPYSDVGLFFHYFAPSYTFTSSLTLATENSRIGRL